MYKCLIIYEFGDALTYIYHTCTILCELYLILLYLSRGFTVHVAHNYDLLVSVEL